MARQRRHTTADLISRSARRELETFGALDRSAFETSMAADCQDHGRQGEEPHAGLGRTADTAATRLLILSDLHLEFAPFKTPDPAGYDAVVLAGDIHSGPKAVHWARRESTFGGKPVILVPGNHEFYGSERTRTLELLRTHAEGSNVHLLDRDEIVVAGVRYLGATLWTDFELDVPHGTDLAQAMRDATRGLTDFGGSIRQRVFHPPGERRFTPRDAAREHALSRAWLQERLSVAAGNADGLPTVVVTHHAPSSRSMDELYEGNDLNPCFYSELPGDFFQHATLWIHGHTHSSSDYLHHRTRVLANPRGYVKWTDVNENERFKADLIVEIGARRG